MLRDIPTRSRQSTPLGVDNLRVEKKTRVRENAENAFRSDCQEQ